VTLAGSTSPLPSIPRIDATRLPPDGNRSKLEIQHIPGRVAVPQGLLESLEAFAACCWPTAELSRDDVAAVQQSARSHAAGGITLTSCQRIERYGAGTCDCDAPVRLAGRPALLHLAAVAAGLDSIVLGEEQILGQVRIALGEGDAQTRALGDIALSAARELRRRTEFHSHSGHLLDRALRLAEAEPSGRLLVVGTGHMARLVALRGLEIGFAEVLVAGRRRPDAPWFAREPRFSFVALDSLPQQAPVEVVAGCLGSAAGELEMSRHLPPVRRLIVDLGMPRNFTGEAELPVITIAALLADDHGRRHSDGRRAQLRAELEALLDRRLAMAAADGKSAVGGLRMQVEEVRRSEVERIQRLHPEIPRETIEVITGSLVNRLFHLPSERLKQIDDSRLREQILALFAPAPLAEAADR
jgi:glutamyl-tRNA reductase